MHDLIIRLARIAQRFLELGHTGTAMKLIHIAQDEQAYERWMNKS